VSALSDTDPETARIHAELLRRAGPVRRAQMAMSLSADVIALARAALRRRDPCASEAELSVRFAELHYGRDVAEGLRQHLLRP
jgi:hypothetical protein